MSPPRPIGLSPGLDAYRNFRRSGDPTSAAKALHEALNSSHVQPEDWERAGAWLRRQDLGERPGAERARVLFLAQCTSAWVANCLATVAWASGAALTITEGQFDNVTQELISAVEKGLTFDAVVLLPWWRELPAQLADPGMDQAIVENWRGAWSIAQGQLRASIVQVGYDLPFIPAEGSHLSGEPGGISSIVRSLNTGLRAELPPGSYFVDLDLLGGDFGRRRLYDLRRFFWTRQPHSEEGALALARWIWAGVSAVRRGPKKALVVDLDNTLWGGVVGELGAAGVGLGDDAEGEAFRAFQRYLRELTKRGVLLAVASKNNLEDAREPFMSNGRMVLALEDFVAFEASWDPKPAMLGRIAAALNIGMDSLVFFDDSPAEREEVRQALPDVAIIEAPADPSDYIRALAEPQWFEATSVTTDDKNRRLSYQAESNRQRFETGFTTRGEYLESLGMRAQILRIEGDILARATQLVAKTNQFNLTNRRHSRDRLTELLSVEGSIGLAVRLSDRFGDYGVISVVVAVPEPGGESLRVDTWVMSCRAIGRTVELMAFGALLARAKDLGYHGVVGEFAPSPKNALVGNLYPALGLQPVRPSEGGIQRFTGSIADLPAPQSSVTLVEKWLA